MSPGVAPVEGKRFSGEWSGTGTAEQGVFGKPKRKTNSGLGIIFFDASQPADFILVPGGGIVPIIIVTY